MAWDDFLVDRIRQNLSARNVVWEEKRMMGGLCFMVDDKMCFAVLKGGLMVRIEPDDLPQLLLRDGASPMEMKGRPMKGYLNIAPEGYDMEADLEFWLEQCLAFNPKAKSSKKKK